MTTAPGGEALHNMNKFTPRICLNEHLKKHVMEEVPWAIDTVRYYLEKKKRTARCVLFDLLKSKRLSRSHETLNISGVYPALIELTVLTESFIVHVLSLARSSKEWLNSNLKGCSKKYKNNEVFIDSHIEFCLKKVNINDPSYVPIQPAAPGRHL